MEISDNRISVIGLGAMGSALARSLLVAGADVQVWNRSPAKAAALQREGAVAWSNIADAIDGCTVAVVCLSDYSVWKRITDDENVRAKLSGLTVIQLTTGNMIEVQEHVELISECGAEVIEGAILCFPEQIGTKGASIIVSGQRDVVNRNDMILRAMSPSITDLGESYIAPVVLSRAAISSILGFLVGTINGAAMCNAGGVPLSAFRTQVEKNAGLMQSEPLRIIDAIKANNTMETQASLSTWGEGHVALLDVARKLEVETSFHEGIRAMFEKSLERGLGEHDLSAMVQTFRPNNNQSE